MGFKKAALATSLLLLGQQAAASMELIVAKGSKFFYENGTQFFIKGIAYQQDSAAGGASTGNSSFIDPLADEAACQRDIPLMVALQTNTIRTYAIDPTADHSACMNLLQEAGIYVISDLGSPDFSINRADPAWNVDLFSHYQAVIDELIQYDNVIGFFAGNEVSNNVSNTGASVYVKAAVRDSKAYIKSKGGRWAGVGYAANDDKDIRYDIAHYFNCGDQDSAIDFWGYNIYEWCGQSTYEESGYQAVTEFFTNYSVPVFFAEYGCNNPGGAAGRIWEDTTALYGSQMSPVLSGGIVYEYFEEANDYGLVSIDGSSASTMKDYDTLKTVIASVSPSSVSSAAYTPTNSAAACPDLTDVWQANGNNLPPTPNADLCDCMYSSLSCLPATGLNSSDYGSIFSYICGASSSSCDGITANTTTGVYGAYIGCNSEQQLGYVLDQYYKSQSKASSACDFNGQATVNKSPSASASCSAVLSSASAANSVAATATTASSSSSSSSTGKSAAAPMSVKALFSIGDLAIGLYVVVAMGVGAAMVTL